MKLKTLNLLKSISDAGYHLFRIVATMTLYTVWINISKSKILNIIIALAAVLYILQPSINKLYWKEIEKVRQQ